MAPDGLSDRQFRRKVFEELQNAGTIDGLKGTLRSRLVGVLQRRDPGVFASSGPEHQTLWQRAANSLYVEYLASQNYGYSLSVFQPECGLTNQQVMTREELSRVLSLSGPIAGHLPASPTSDAPGAPPLLVSLLQGVADMGGAGARREIQTQTDDDGGNSSLSLRLAQIDEMHERAVETERAAPRLDAEARMASFQKECESRLRAEMEEQVRRVRDHEVGQARLEEAAKHRRQIKEARASSSACTPSACANCARARGEPDGARARRRVRSSAPRSTTASGSPPSTRRSARRRPPRSKRRLRASCGARARTSTSRGARRRWRPRSSSGRRATRSSPRRRSGAPRRGAWRRTPRRSSGSRRSPRRCPPSRTSAPSWRRTAPRTPPSSPRWRARAARRRRRARTRASTPRRRTSSRRSCATRAQLDAARDALEKRGVPLPVAASDVGAGGIGMGLAMNAGVASGAVSPGAGGPAYSQLVAATERAKAETQLARAEIAQRRGDLARIKRERNTAMAERGDAVREAAEWKGKCELANAMLDEAVRRAEETWATMQDTKATMRVMLDEERDKRVRAEAAAAAFRTAAEIPGVTAKQLGLRSSLDDDVKARAGTDDSPTVNVLRLQQLEHQQETQRSALDQYKRKLTYERQAQEASAAVAAADLVAIRRADAARAKAEQEKHKFYVAESAAAGAREEEPESAEKPASPKAASPKAASPKPASPKPASPKQEDAAEAKRRSEAAAALEADRKKREALSAKIAAAQAADAAPAAPAAAPPARPPRPRPPRPPRRLRQRRRVRGQPGRTKSRR